MCGEHVEETAEQLKTKAFKTVHLLFPDVPCDRWCVRLNDLPNTMQCAIDPEDDEPVWLDDAGHDIGLDATAWWFMKICK